MSSGRELFSCSADFRTEFGAEICHRSAEYFRAGRVHIDALTENPHCPGMHRLSGIWRQRLAQLVLWMAGP